MKSKNSLFSFAKAKGNLVAVALAAVLMAANITVASAQNKVTENNGTELTIIGGIDDLTGIDPSSAYCANGTNVTDGNKCKNNNRQTSGSQSIIIIYTQMRENISYCSC